LVSLEVLFGEIQRVPAAKGKGHGGRPPRLSTEPFAKDELTALKQEILEALCDSDTAECPECSLEGGPNDPEIFEVVRELPSAFQQCPMRLQLSLEYRQWVEKCLDLLNALPEGAGCEAVRRIKSKEVSLPWAFVMVYMHLVFALGDLKDIKEAVTTHEGMETTREEGYSRFFKAHAYTQKQLKSAIDSFEIYKNCCSNDERYRFIHPEHLGEIHRIRRRLISLTEAALACCGHLDNWIAESYSPNNLKALGEFLAARILPAFIEQGQKYCIEKWWAEASVIMSAGMLALPHASQPTINAPDFDAEYLRNLGRKDRAEGEHMLFYLSNPHPEDSHLAELCLDYLRGLSEYHGKTIEPRDERE
jgi:hypothetical protein